MYPELADILLDLVKVLLACTGLIILSNVLCGLVLYAELKKRLKKLERSLISGALPPS